MSGSVDQGYMHAHPGELTRFVRERGRRHPPPRVAPRRPPRRDAGLRPAGDDGELCGENPYIDLKYQFAEGEPRLRFRDLTVGILNRLARLHRADDPGPVRREELETTTDGEIAALDEATFEMAYLIAGLAAADGAVVMSKRHELPGFGGEISGTCQRRGRSTSKATASGRRPPRTAAPATARPTAWRPRCRAPSW